jgi:hypothetical protein
MAYLSPDEMDARERAYDLSQIRGARPSGEGTCSQCRKVARARFPVFVNCVNRVLVEMNCATCAMTPPPADMRRYYCAVVSRSDCERILKERAT